MAESIKPAVLQQILASAQGVHSDNTNCNCLICVVKKFVSTPETTTTNSGSKNKHNCSNTTNTSSTTNTISTSTAGSSNPIRGNNQKPIAVPSKDIKSTETDTSDDDDDDWPPPHKKFVVVKKTLCPINKFCVPCNWIRSNPTSDTAVKTKPVLAEQQTPRRPRSPSTPRIGSARRSPPIAAHKRPHSSRNDNNNKKVNSRIVIAERTKRAKILTTAIWSNLILPIAGSSNHTSRGSDSQSCSLKDSGHVSKGEYSLSKKIIKFPSKEARSEKSNFGSTEERSRENSRSKKEGGVRT